MKARWSRFAAVLPALLSLANRRAGPLKPEPLRPFSEFEALLLRGSLVVAAIVATWFIIVLVRDWLKERRQAKARQDPLLPPKTSRTAATEPPGKQGL